MRKECGAKLRNKPGVTCRKPPLLGKKRCRLHGGGMQSGINHPTFKHGRYSRVLPKDLLAKYLAAAEDPELLSHQDELRLIDAHLGDLIEAINTCQQRNVTEEAIDAWGLFSKAKTTEDQTRGYQQLERLLGSRSAEYPPTWGEVREVVDLRKKILQAETSRLKEIDGYMRREDVVMINIFTQEAIRRGVMAFVNSELGEQIIQQIGRDLALLVGAGTSPGLDAAAGRVIDVNPELG